jgi:hypothetical protein
MIFWLVLKLEIRYIVMISWRILVSFRGCFEDYIFAWWNIWVSIILLLHEDILKCKWQGESVTHPLFIPHIWIISTIKLILWVRLWWGLRCGKGRRSQSHVTCFIRELSVKYPNFGVLNPSFAKSNEIKKSGWKPYTEEKRGDQTGFLTLTWASPSSMDLLYLLHLHCCCSFSSLVVTIQSCKSCELLPSFAHFPPILKLGMEQGSHGQAKAQTQGDFKDDSNSCHAHLHVS